MCNKNSIARVYCHKLAAKIPIHFSIRCYIFQLKFDPIVQQLVAFSRNDGSAEFYHYVPHFVSPKRKRCRLNYSCDQLAILEANYKRKKFPNNDDRIKLAREMNLDPKRLQVWWQNRRSKEKLLEKQSMRSENMDDPNVMLNEMDSRPSENNDEPVYQIENKSAAQSTSQLDHVPDRTRRISTRNTNVPEALDSPLAPNPLTSNLLLPYQYQYYQSSNQSIDMLPHVQWPHPNYFWMPYQHAPAPYMPNGHYYPQIEHNSFLRGGLPVPYSHVNGQSSGLLPTTAEHENLVLPFINPYSYTQL